VSFAFTWMFYFFIPNFLFGFHWVRMRFDPLAMFEGNWTCILLVDDDGTGTHADTRTCGFYNFKFDKYKKCYLHTGENYDKEGNLVTHFTMDSVHYSTQINGFSYSGTATRRIDNITEKINCWGEISFMDANGKTVDSASGFL